MEFLTNLIGGSFFGSAVRYIGIAAIVGSLSWLYLTIKEKDRLEEDLEKAESYNEVLRGQVNQLASLNQRNMDEFDLELDRREVILEAVQRTVRDERILADQIETIDEGLRDAEDYNEPLSGVWLDTVNELRRIRGLPPVGVGASADDSDGSPVPRPGDTRNPKQV